MRFAPGRSPGEAAWWLHCTTPSGSVITLARCGKPASWYTPKARQVAPFGSKSDSWGIATPRCSRKAFWDQDASQETPNSRAPAAWNSSSTSL
jgi:hypothetical protein